MEVEELATGDGSGEAEWEKWTRPEDGLVGDGNGQMVEPMCPDLYVLYCVLRIRLSLAGKTVHVC